MRYKLIERIDWSYVEAIQDDGTVLSIPCDPANSDYQEYLKSLEEK